MPLGVTPTEREILEALADGSSPRELSEQRNCSESTIATHRKNICRKLGIHKAYQLKICIALLHQDRENEKIITTLEQEKQTVQEQAVQLLDKNEELQGQFEAAQADAQRLAYFRKSEIDPATYEMFLVGYDMLTPTEREILEALADGSSPREISEQRNCSESTIATHRKNIYRKLGIHKAYQLKICIALLRQEREAQN